MRASPVYILVHGAFQDGSCWDKVASRMRAAGATVLAPNLPGHAPAENANPGAIGLGDYVTALSTLIAAQPAPVILVGHSLGGATVSQTAEAVGPKIAKLVFLAAYLPLNGESAQDLALTDEGSQLGAGFHVDPARGVATVEPDTMRTAFLNRCSPEDVALGLAGYRIQPIQPFGTPLSLTDAGYGAVEKIYIHTSADLTVSHALQQRMVARQRFAAIHTLDADHAAYLDAAEPLAELLLAIGA